ncbi:MAG: HAD hydrolase-like protein [Rhodobacteraceae bacterium]|nr:HAD hydrolase-like protein [Paracoccaceae bacterium]
MSDDLRDAEAAFLRYEAVRARLPAARFPEAPMFARDLGEVADRWDGFVLDAFGVLNVGETPIPGAVARMAELRARGKKLCVLTNAASYTRAEALRKYRNLGFDFSAEEVVSSRDVAAARIGMLMPGAHWAAIAAEGDRFSDLPGRVGDAVADHALFDVADGVLFLSSARWTPALQARLMEAMARRPIPIVVANPDLVAPREDGLSLEPGLFAHAVLDAVGGVAHWYGKPFADGFHDVCARTGLPPERLAMVGDTLHTDVLGGRAAGMGAVLVADHGLFAGRDVRGYIARSGIVPDAVVATT